MGEMKYLNLLIQLFWVGVALFVGYYIASSVFGSLFWQCVFSGVFSLTAYFLLYFISSYIKAFNDLDVRAASALGMSVNHYRLYKQYYNEWQDVMNKYGTDSKEADRKFDEIFSKIASTYLMIVATLASTVLHDSISLRLMIIMSMI